MGLEACVHISERGLAVVYPIASFMSLSLVHGAGGPEGLEGGASTGTGPGPSRAMRVQGRSR